MTPSAKSVGRWSVWRGSRDNPPPAGFLVRQGFSEHQYIAARHNDKEHVHVAINKLHPETFRIHSPAWDHQKLFTAGRDLEVELGLTPLRSRARDREKVPQRAADYEAHQGIDSFARWARKTHGPALRATELRCWDDVHEACGRFGVALRLRGNGLVFEDAERGVRVKASCVGREFSKPRLCKRLGNFQAASAHQVEASEPAAHRYSPMPSTVAQSLWNDYTQSLDQARMQRQPAWSSYRDSASCERRRFKEKYRHQRGLLAALPISGRDNSYFHNSSRSAKPSNLGPSSASSQTNERRFRNPRTLAVGVSSLPDAPRTATPVRLEFCLDESRNEAHGISPGARKKKRALRRDG